MHTARMLSGMWCIVTAMVLAWLTGHDALSWRLAPWPTAHAQETRITLLAGPQRLGDDELAVRGWHLVSTLAGLAAPSGYGYAVVELLYTNQRSQQLHRFNLSQFTMLVEDGQYVYRPHPITAHETPAFADSHTYAPGESRYGRLVFLVPEQTGDLALVQVTTDGLIVLDLSPRLSAPPPPAPLAGPKAAGQLGAVLYSVTPLDAPQAAAVGRHLAAGHYLVVDLALTLLAEEPPVSVPYDPLQYIVLRDNAGHMYHPAPIWNRLSRLLHRTHLVARQPTRGQVAFWLPDGGPPPEALRLEVHGGTAAIVLPLAGEAPHPAPVPAPAAPPTPSQRVAVLLEQARRLLDQNKLTTPQGESANDRYLEVLQVAPDNPDALEGLATIYQRYVTWGQQALQRGTYDKALRYCERAMSVQADRPDCYPIMGEAYTKTGQHEQALHVYREAMQRDPPRASLYRTAMARVRAAQEQAARPNAAQVQATMRAQNLPEVRVEMEAASQQITLTGYVTDADEEKRALAIAHNLAGNRRVRNQLTNRMALLRNQLQNRKLNEVEIEIDSERDMIVLTGRVRDDAEEQLALDIAARTQPGMKVDKTGLINRKRKMKESLMKGSFSSN